MNKELDKTLFGIIEVSGTINKVYQKIENAKHFEKLEEFKTQLEHLKLASQYEEELYTKINLEENLNELLYNRFAYLMKHSDIPLEQQWLHINRFRNHINEILITTPFLSQQKDPITREEENMASITFQANRDYSISSLYYIDEEWKKEPKRRAKRHILDGYYNFAFQNKFLEAYLKYAPKQPEASGRKRCKCLNQNPINTDNIYKEFIKTSLESNIEDALSFSDEILETWPEEYGKLKLFLSFIRASIEIATEKEQKTLSFAVDKDLLPNSEKSWNCIKQVFAEIPKPVAQTITPQKKKSKTEKF